MPRITQAGRPRSAVEIGGPEGHAFLDDVSASQPHRVRRGAEADLGLPPPVRRGLLPRAGDPRAQVPALLASSCVEHAVAMAALWSQEAPALLRPNLHALPVQAAAKDPRLLCELLRSCVRAGPDAQAHAPASRQMRRPWTGPFAVLVKDLLAQSATAEAITLLAPVWPGLLDYRGPAQREQLTFHLARNVLAPPMWGANASVVPDLVDDHSRGAQHKNVLLANLAVLAMADGSVLDDLRVCRFLNHRRSCRDSRKMRTVMNFLLSTEHMGRYQAARLMRTVLGAGAHADAPTGGSVRDAHRSYAQKTVPHVLELCTLYASYLRMGQPLRAVAPEARADARALRRAVARALLGTDDAALAQQLEAQLQSWRLPMRLFTFAGHMLGMADSGTAAGLMRRMLRALLSGSYAAERAHLGALAALPAALRAVWTAGESMPLAALPLPERVCNALPSGWTLHDGCESEDFINSGSDVHGSCQDVEGDPSFTQTLLGRMLDGRKRMLMLKNETGEIVARAMFRLLHSAQGAPVALLSKTYLNASLTPTQARKILLSFARRRACALRLPLVAARCAYPVQLDWTCDLHASSGAGPDYWDELGAASKCAKYGAVRLPGEDLQLLQA